MNYQFVWDDLIVSHRLALLFLFDSSFSEIIRTIEIKEHHILEISPNRRKEVFIFRISGEECTATRVFFNVSNPVTQRTYEIDAPRWILYNSPLSHNGGEFKYINKLLSEFSLKIKNKKTTL